MFPVTDSSETIAEALRDAAKKAGVQVRTGSSLLSVEKAPKNGFKLEARRARVEPSRNEAKILFLHTKKLLIATQS
jgi:predicted flavoprotein YhiN